MTGLCQYCACPVAHADRFYRLGHMPICDGCRWIPALLAGCHLLFAAAVGLGAWLIFRGHP